MNTHQKKFRSSSGNTVMRTLRRTALFISITAFVSAFVSTAAAATIPGLFNTGTLNDGSLAGGGSVDLHYALTASADPSSTAFVTSTIPSGFWIANGPNSQWIAPDPNQNFSGLGDSPGSYVYRLTFNLAGFDSTTASIAGQWAVDDIGQDIKVNGVSTGQITGSGISQSNFNTFHSFTINSGFAAGINTLDFLVLNDPNNFGLNPTGLRVEFLSATASPVPVPVAAWLFGSGLMGLAAVARRKRVSVVRKSNMNRVQ